MPLFLRTRQPLRREKLILGGAITYRPRAHRLRVPAITVAKHGIPAAGKHRNLAAGKQRGSTTARKRPAAARKLPSTQRSSAPKRQAPLRRRRQGVLAGPKGRLTHRRQAASGSRRRPPPPKRLATERRPQADAGPKQVLNQLAKSRQIQRAVKGVVAQNRHLPALGKRAVTHAVTSVLANRGQKRPAKENSQDEQQQQSDASLPPAKRPRFAPAGYARIGYRGKSIQRGGTKQRGGGAGFLF